jgi:hypothetical protein
MACNEDDGNRDASFDQSALNIQPTHSRKPYIQNEATGDIRKLVSEEFLRRGKRLGMQAHRSEQALRGRSHAVIIIDNEHNGLIS